MSAPSRNVSAAHGAPVVVIVDVPPNVARGGPSRSGICEALLARTIDRVTPGSAAVTAARRWDRSICAGNALAAVRGMKKHVTTKRVLALRTETLRELGNHDLTKAVVGGGSGTYCAGCGTGTACPWLKI